MTTVEILKHHLKNRIDCGFYPFENWSNMVNEALEVAIAALEQQVKLDAIFEQPKADDDVTVDDYLKSVCTGQHVEYHYLPEVPHDERWVNGFNITKDGKTHSHVCNYRFSFVDPTDRGWFGKDGFAIVGIYAWCEILPNPPVIPTEEQP